MRPGYVVPALLALALVSCAARPTGAATLRGTVAASDGTPLVGASIIVPRLERGTVTGASGQFHIDALPADTLTVVVQFIGYERVVRTIDLRHGNAFEAVILQEDVGLLDEVVVEDEQILTRAEQSTSVLEGVALDEARGATLGETIERLPGVTTLTTGPGIRKPVIRGLYGERVQIVSEGLAQEGQQWGAEHAPAIDPFAPARIEVVRGAASVEYGSGAIGGIVRLEDEPLPRGGTVAGSALLQTFSNSGQVAGSVIIEGSPAPMPDLGFRVQGSARRAGDARTPDYVLGNTALYERSAELAAAYSRRNFVVDFHVSHFATDIGIYRGSHFSTFDALDTVLATGRPPVDYAFSYEIDAPKQEVAHELATVRARLKGVDGSTAEIRYGFQHNRRREFDADRVGGRDPLARPAYDLSLATHTLDARLETRVRPLAGGSGFGVVGLSGESQGNRNLNGYLIPNFRAVSVGAFARATWVGGPWNLEAGSRLELRRLTAFPRVAESGTGFERSRRRWAGGSGALGAIRRIGRNSSLAANLAAGWRPPAVNELYSYGVHHGTAQFEIGDDRLEAERSLGLDLTYRHARDGLRAELSGYANRIDDYIYLRPTGAVMVTVRGVFPEFRQAQTTALLIGFDGGISTDFTQRISLEATVAAVRGQDRSANRPLFQMPADRASATLRVDLPGLRAIGRPQVRLTSTFVRRQDRVPTRTTAEGEEVSLDYVPPPAGYVLLAGGLRGEFDSPALRVSYGVSIENLLDTAYRDYLSRYRYFANDMGRNVTLRLGMHFGRSNSAR